MGKLNAGDLDQRVTIVTSAVQFSDGQGGYVAAGPDLENGVWAKVRTLRAAEKLALGQQLASEAIQVTVRAAPGINRTTQQRVLWQKVTYAVQAVETDSRKEYVILTCFSSGTSGT
jgi:SPP1 family predicted phage head-tail adaptor